MDRVKRVNLDITSRCTLGCSTCDRAWYKENNVKIPKNDMTIEEFDKVSNYFTEIYFCGQMSDPIFHPNFIDFLKMCDDKNVKVSVHTAASHQPREWYVRAFNANKNAEWIFGVDGLPKDSHKYRINQDGEKLFEMMKLAVSLGNKVTWQYIVFDYNEEDQIEAYGIAKKEKMRFMLIESSRFYEDEYLKPKEGFAKKETRNDFRPQCLEDKEYGWDYKGRLLPCCWFWKPQNEHLTFSNIMDDKFKIDKVNNVEEIVNSKEWIEFHRMLKENPENAPDICKYKCGVRGGKTSTRTHMKAGR
jgi:MoaA/NifB/PqqE/SkfB family radical SAM enzyme